MGRAPPVDGTPTPRPMTCTPPVTRFHRLPTPPDPQPNPCPRVDVVQVGKERPRVVWRRAAVLWLLTFVSAARGSCGGPANQP
jgi:hypothetical protein